MSGWRSEEQGERLGGVLAVVTQAGGDLADAGPMQEADGGLAQEGPDSGPVPLMDEALILAQDHILDAVEASLAGPMPALERQEAVRRPCLGPPARDPSCSARLASPCSRQVRTRRQTWATPGQSR